MSETEETNEILINQNTIKKYVSNSQFIKFVQNKFKRLTVVGTIKLIELILTNIMTIRAEDIVGKKWKSFHRYNLSIFDENKILKMEEIKKLRQIMYNYLVENNMEIIPFEKEKHNSIGNIDENNSYVLNKANTYDSVIKLICDERGDITLKYDFDKVDLQSCVPKNLETLQRTNIQILTTPIKFDYPLEYVYNCSICGNETRKKEYEVVGSRGNFKCDGVRTIETDEGIKSKQCNFMVAPDIRQTLVKSAYFYIASYEDENNNRINCSIFSFNKYTPGFYDGVMFKISNPKNIEFFHLIDVKEMELNKFVFPQQTEENYLFTLQRQIDMYIKQQTGLEIFGLYPIKCALILQTLANRLQFPLIYNIQLVGDASTGKSMILKYYGFTLNGQLNLSTNGISISIPGLRGTREKEFLFDKEVKMITIGYLGTYYTIHIDEAGENRELVQNLKTFLAEENYSYDKAGSYGVFHRRISHINLSENLDYNHLGQYRGIIRKIYRELNVKIGEEEKPEWKEEWDLHLPLFKYINPYLKSVIKSKRMEYQLKKQFWIDGYDYAFHDRVAVFYFFIVNEKENKELDEMVGKNVGKNIIKENLKLITKVNTRDLDIFFKSLEKFKSSEEDVNILKKVNLILLQYGINVDIRMKEAYCHLVKMSRIINKRLIYKEEDYNLLKWFLENTNCKLDVADTNNYTVIGAPDLKMEEEIDKQIEESTKRINEFGLPHGDFD